MRRRKKILIAVISICVLSVWIIFFIRMHIVVKEHMIKFASKLNALLRCSSKYIVPLLQISCAHLSLSKNTTVAPET